MQTTTTPGCSEGDAVTSSGSRRRYAIVGAGSRSRMFYEAMAGVYSSSAVLVAVCDTNQTRMDLVNETLTTKFGAKPVATYKADQFENMIKEQRPDVVVVTTVDRTHHAYIVRSLELGCDVITEKPMTTAAEPCQQIIDAAKATGRKVRVAFNYRYAPPNKALRDLIEQGAIGDVFSVHFEWLLDTVHGADYFRRWHRDKQNSGGLLVHKATHHFDLVNFWIDDDPRTVFAYGDLRFYGRENAASRGISAPWQRTTGIAAAAESPFALDLNASETLKALYLDAEHEDGYLRDQNVFGDGITIEDTMSVLVRYKQGAQMTYALTAYSPWEGFNVALNGTNGRITLQVGERPTINTSDGPVGEVSWKKLTVHRLHEEPYDVELPKGEGSHGGGDVVMLDEIFGGAAPVFTRASDHRAGALSILTGVAADQSIREGQPIDIADLVKF